MTEPQLITAAERAGIVEAYKRGDKIHDIQARFGVARATIYWVLEKAEVSPDRVKRGSRLVGDDQQLAQLYELIEAQDVRIKELEAALAKAKRKSR